MLDNFDEFGNDLSEPCPTLDESRAARQERETEWIAEFRKQRLARERLANDTLVSIAPIADDGLGGEFESEPFVNAARRNSERDEQEREWERDRGAA